MSLHSPNTQMRRKKRHIHLRSPIPSITQIVDQSAAFAPIIHPSRIHTTAGTRVHHNSSRVRTIFKSSRLGRAIKVFFQAQSSCLSLKEVQLCEFGVRIRVGRWFEHGRCSFIVYVLELATAKTVNGGKRKSLHLSRHSGSFLISVGQSFKESVFLSAGRKTFAFS